MRIEPAFLASLGDSAEVREHRLAGKELSALRPFFSSREFSLLKEIRLFPFAAESEIVALLLVLDSEALDHPIDDLSALSASTPAAAHKIRTSRLLLEPALGSGSIEEARSRLGSLLAATEHEAGYAVVARVDLDRAATLLQGDPTTADIYRFKCDIAGALARMVSAGGELITISQGIVVLVIRSRTPYSDRLLSHQIDAGIRALVSGSPKLDSLTERTWKFPHDGLTIEALVDAAVG